MGLGYAFKEAVLGFHRTRGMSLVSVATIAVSLLVFGVFLLVALNLYDLVRKVKARVEIEVYLSDQVDQKEALGLKGKIETLEGVKEVVYVSKDLAASEFRQAFGEGLLDAVSQNPLPASLRVKLEDGFRTSGKIARIVTQIENNRGIEEIQYGREWVERLDHLIRIFAAIVLLIGLVIGLASVFVISNSVNLTILARRESIEIMRLVGATDGFIRFPFLLEGIIGGTLGGLIAATILYFAYHWATLRFPHLILTSADLPAVSMVPLGAILGGIGSRVSIRRVLKSLI